MCISINWNFFLENISYILNVYNEKITWFNLKKITSYTRSGDRLEVLRSLKMNICLEIIIFHWIYWYIYSKLSMSFFHGMGKFSCVNLFFLSRREFYLDQVDKSVYSFWSFQKENLRGAAVGVFSYIIDEIFISNPRPSIFCLRNATNQAM